VEARKNYAYQLEIDETSDISDIRSDAELEVECIELKEEVPVEVKIKHLMSFGFNEANVRDALFRSQDDLDVAYNKLKENYERYGYL